MGKRFQLNLSYPLYETLQLGFGGDERSLLRRRKLSLYLLGNVNSKVRAFSSPPNSLELDKNLFQKKEGRHGLYLCTLGFFYENL